MSVYQPSKINQSHVYFNYFGEQSSRSKILLGIFLGQKVVLCYGNIRVTGRVMFADIHSVVVEVFGDLDGFILSETRGIFMPEKLEFPLSPTLLGRKLDFLGSPLDQMSSVLPIFKVQNLLTNTAQIKSKEYIIDKILPKGELIKINNLELDTITKLLDNPNIALILGFLNKHSLTNDLIIDNLKQQNLDKISLILESNTSSVTNLQFLFCLEALTQTSRYFAQELGFDVLVFITDFNSLDSLNDDLSDSSSSVTKPSVNFAGLYGKGSVSVVVL